MADPFEALVAQPAAQAAPDPFAALVASKPAPAVVPQGKSDPFAELVQGNKGFPVQQVGQMPIETQVWNEVKDAVPDTVKEMAGVIGEKVMTSPIGSAIKYLNKPVNALSAGVTYGLDKTVSPGIQQALNPKNEIAPPDLSYHDIVNFVAPSNDQAQKYLEGLGFSQDTAQYGRLAYATGKTGLGLAADLFFDPMMYLGAGELTKAGKASEITRLNEVAAGTFDAMKSVAPERYALSMGAGDAKLGITTDQVSNAIKAAPYGEKALDVASRPGVQKAIKTGAGAGLGYSVLGPAGAVVGGTIGYKSAAIIAALDYHTGVPEVDSALSLHGATVRGDIDQIKETFVKDLNGYKFTDGEKDVLSSAIEATPNAASKEDLLKAVQEHSARLEVNVGKAGVSGAWDKMRGVNADSRMEQIADAGVKIKAQNALDLEQRLASGALDPLTDNVMENYLVHKISPEARAWMTKNPEKAAAIQETILAQATNKATADSILSTYDAGKRSRQLRETLENANKILEEKTGLNSFFIKDPILATAMKRANTMKMVRDSELIGKMERLGITAEQAKSAGIKNFREIDTPELRGNGLLYSPRVANAVEYYVKPKAVGNVSAMVDSYHRVFRGVALYSLPYFERNTLENMFKGWVQGVKMSDYVDVLKISSQKGAIEIGGKMVPASDVRKLVSQFGIDSGNAFKEGVKSFMDLGKQVESDRVLAKAVGGTQHAVGKTLNLLREGGEASENTARRALFVNRMKQGYSPAAAALEVEKYMFDYTRKTANMDTLRRFWDPFAQHAFKTLMISPEMLGKGAGKYNFLHNNMLQAIQAGIHDPVTTQEVLNIIPQYQQIRDPIVGPIFTGNSWLQRIFTNKTAIDRDGKIGTAMLFQHDIGLTILNRYAQWNDILGKSGGMTSPLFGSLAIVATGRDPFSGKIVDPSTHSADMARRFNYAMWNSIEGAFPLPNVAKFVGQQMGWVSPEYVTPNGVLAMNMAAGKFVTVTNLDREYGFRMMAMQAAQKDLYQSFLAQAKKELSGRTADVWLSDKPYLRDIRKQINPTSDSNYLLAKYQSQMRGDAGIVDSAQGLQGQMTASEIATHLKELNKTISAAAKQYEVMQQYRLEQLKNAPKAVIQQMAPGSNPR